MRLYRTADHRKSVADIFEGRKVLVFSPTCSPSDLYTRFPRRTVIRNKWEDILEELKDGGRAQNVAVFPNGSIQYVAI